MAISGRNNRARYILALLKKLKLRLQFTGWLQYLPLAAGAGACFLVAAALALVGATLTAGISGVLGGMLLVAFLYDLTTVKWNIRPRERLPKRCDDWDLFDLMKSRHSCRSFQDRFLTAEHRAGLMAWVGCHVRPTGHPYFEHSTIRLEYVSAPLTV